MEPIRTIKSKTVVLNVDNIDTDQIIPARFLKCTTKEGLGKALFTDWRYEPDGGPKADFVLNKPEAKGCTVLVAGDNFGCGSSREHAPWALTDFGLKAIVSTSFADIFRNNALKNGLIPVIVGAEMHKKLVAQPGIEVVVDLDARTISLPDGSKSEFPIDAFARYCLMEGIDSLEFLMRQEKDIAAFEKSLG